MFNYYHWHVLDTGYAFNLKHQNFYYVVVGLFSKMCLTMKHCHRYGHDTDSDTLTLIIIYKSKSN